jgi:hypothetical protein
MYFICSEITEAPIYVYPFSKHCHPVAGRNKMSDPRLKQLKIKTGVLKRVGKEKLSYRNLSSFNLSFYAYILGNLLDKNIL